MDKPPDILLDDEINGLRNAMIEAVNRSRLPMPVIKLVIQSTARDISLAITGQLDGQRNKKQNGEDRA